jgi:hypothetical protein
VAHTHNRLSGLVHPERHHLVSACRERGRHMPELAGKILVDE